MSRGIAVLLVFAGLSIASTAEAQIFHHRGKSPGVSGHTVVSQGSGSYVSPTPMMNGSTTSGFNDFPYYGSGHGHPYDRWTWPMMSGSYGQGLARYYDPPVK